MTAVIGVLPSQDPAVNRSVEIYAAGVMTRTSSGGVHTEESYRAWLEEPRGWLTSSYILSCQRCPEVLRHTVRFWSQGPLRGLALRRRVGA